MTAPPARTTPGADVTRAATRMAPPRPPTAPPHPPPAPPHLPRTPPHPPRTPPHRGATPRSPRPIPPRRPDLRLGGSNAISGPRALCHTGRCHAQDEDSLGGEEALSQDGLGQAARPSRLHQPHPGEEAAWPQAPAGEAGRDLQP